MKEGGLFGQCNEFVVILEQHIYLVLMSSVNLYAAKTTKDNYHSRKKRPSVLGSESSAPLYGKLFFAGFMGSCSYVSIHPCIEINKLNK